MGLVFHAFEFGENIMNITLGIFGLGRNNSPLLTRAHHAFSFLGPDLWVRGILFCIIISEIEMKILKLDSCCVTLTVGCFSMYDELLDTWSIIFIYLVLILIGLHDSN